jgi:hypothetical protein
MKGIVYEKRKLLEYYKIADRLNRYESIPIVKCTYGGNTYVMSDGRFVMKSLPNYVMPFHAAQTRVIVKK